MGCTSSTYLPNGEIAPGQGEALMELDPDSRLKLMFYWSGKGNDMSVEIKAGFGKEMITGTWDRVADGHTQAMWAEVPPAMLQFRYVIDHERIQYPGAMTLGLCEKIYLQHSVDPSKFSDLCVKAAKQSKEEHAYKAANGIDVAKSDLDALQGYVSAHQISENLQPLKKALVLIEDTIPGNLFNTTAKFEFDHGFWQNDATRVLSTGEQIRLQAEAKLQNPAVVRQITMKTSEIARKLITQSMDTACSMIGMKREELLPTLEGMLDMLEGRKPGSVAKPQDDGVKHPDVTPGDIDKEKQNLITKLWSIDQPALATLRVQDSEDKSYVMSLEENKMAELVDRLEKHYAKKFDPKTVTGDGVAVMARYHNCDLYEALATQIAQDNTIKCEFPENKLENADYEWLLPIDKVKKKVYIPHPPKEVEVDRVNITQMPPHPEWRDLAIGLKVRVLHATKKYYYDADIIDIDDAAQKLVVRDMFMEVEKDVGIPNTWLKTKLSDIAAKPRLIRQNFYNVQFKWVAALVPGQTVTLNIWRAGARDATLMEIEMVTFTKAAIPTKEKPKPTEPIHGGWVCLAPVQIGRMYCINYVVQGPAGKAVFVDFNKPAATADAYRRFYMKLNL